MSDESLQHKLDRVRPPRVHITYDVETGGAIETRELPFLVGVLADLSGQPEVDLPKLKDRRFVEIDRDNFDQVMAKCTPRITLSVDNMIDEEGGKLPVTLHFNKMEDFEPLNVVTQIPRLNELLLVRQKLSDLATKLEGNDVLSSLLSQLMDSPQAQEKVRASASAASGE